MLISENTSLSSFVRKLQDPVFFKKVGPGFALIKPGDWSGFVRWIESLGYAVTLEALHILCRDNPKILEQMAKSEYLAAWNLQSLRNATQAKAV